MTTDPIGYKDDMNMYAYVKNDPMNRNDFSGEDSYLVGRPLDLGFNSRIGHAYIVVDADYVGDPKARIISFGKLKNGKMGNVNDASRAHSSSAKAYDTDVKDWTSRGGKRLGSLVDIGRLGAPDAVVEAFANNVRENLTYTPTPIKEGTDNSNSGAASVATRSSELTGNSNGSPGRNGLGFPGENQQNHVSFNSFSVSSGGYNYEYNAQTGKLTRTQNHATTGTRIRRKEKLN